MSEKQKNITYYFLDEKDVKDEYNNFNCQVYEKPNSILKIEDILLTNFMSTSKKQLADQFIYLNKINHSHNI